VTGWTNETKLTLILTLTLIVTYYTIPSDGTQRIYAPNLHVCPYPLYTIVQFMYHGSTMVPWYSWSTTIIPCYTHQVI